ncbi:uncharacterized protein L969DRAFT_94273 [Mixia osmundae IAM 14324]|uniref:Uncharacterized protein n=1 Tax=Mixia osmundae (strain CBS 9802 / IAM 14324 / JCM 22182 / KY 12970) TaxID=764103 RepID=G7E8D1_MIXOS|nr:uncharacterized protein L969DRAFT_94273 [Mixia osmundae IAM 14324]KEI39194.1 hypothetical protein L969DRAFT_94273 [Mixia osmundae IAM 14324]GAA99091.1 hypothetical protein E5Q_05780 [Mixia osmundae IAM 14324]
MKRERAWTSPSDAAKPIQALQRTDTAPRLLTRRPLHAFGKAIASPFSGGSLADTIAA